MIVHQPDTILFDVDGTLTQREWVDAALLPRLIALRERGLRLALCTARSLREAVDFVTRELGATVVPGGLFNGGLVLEDGHVWLPPGATDLAQVEVLTSPAAQVEMEQFRRAFAAAWRPAPDPLLAAEGWGTVAGAPAPLVQEIPSAWRTLGSVTIWTWWPPIPEPASPDAESALAQWGVAAATALDLRHTEVFDAGRYGLRLLERGRNKGTALAGLGYDLARTLFIGDSANDLPVVYALRAAGGSVMAVANAISPIKEAAVAVSAQPASTGVVELLTLLETWLDRPAEQLNQLLRSE